MDAPARYLDDLHLCQECLEGDTRAIQSLQSRFGPVMRAFLCSSGAKEAEAEETIQRLWADLLVDRPDRPARLRLFQGTSSLQTWLNVVALNRLVSRKRDELRWQQLHQPADGTPTPGEAGEPALCAEERNSLLPLMREALEIAFAACAPEEFVLLHLKHLDRLSGAELSRMFGCDQPTISRRLAKAEAHIQAATLAHIRRTDPWLDLKWSDFIELCRTATPACFGLD